VAELLLRALQQVARGPKPVAVLSAVNWRDNLPALVAENIQLGQPVAAQRRLNPVLPAARHLLTVGQALFALVVLVGASPSRPLQRAGDDTSRERIDRACAS